MRIAVSDKIFSCMQLQRVVQHQQALLLELWHSVAWPLLHFWASELRGSRTHQQRWKADDVCFRARFIFLQLNMSDMAMRCGTAVVLRRAVRPDALNDFWPKACEHTMQ